MRSPVLVALVLQLVLILTEAKEKYEFGDLISFKRKCACKIGLSYKHFAVYVGDEEDLPGQKAGQDIFQRTGKNGATGDCGFGVLKKQKGEIAKHNYLDEYFSTQMGTPAHRDQMIERIKYWNDPANCGTYNLLKNNCEHLATHVRYGYKVLQQPGTAAGRGLTIGSKIVNVSEFNKLLEAMEENERRRDECHKSCSSSAENAGTKSQPHLTAIVVPIVVVSFLFVIY